MKYQKNTNIPDCFKRLSVANKREINFLKRGGLLLLIYSFVLGTATARNTNSSTFITINNASESSIVGAVQSNGMPGMATDDINGTIEPMTSYTYYPDDDWFNHPSININEGDTIPIVGLFDQNTQQYITCGEDVLYTGANDYTYDGVSCGESSIEYQGIEVWDDTVNYPVYAEVVGSNGITYRSLVENGPDSSGPVDPVDGNTSIWQEKVPQLAVGEILFVTGSITPTMLGYVGLWEEIESGAALGTVSSGSAMLGSVTGSNLKSPPLPEHAHTASSTFVGEALPPHSHTQTFGATTSAGGQPHGFDGGDQIRPNASTHSASAGTPTGTVLTTIEAAGEPQSTINVQGRVLNGVLWKRVE